MSDDPLAAIFLKKPDDLTRQDIDRVIAQFREMRAKGLIAPTKAAKAPKAPAPPKIDLTEIGL